MTKYKHAYPKSILSHAWLYLIHHDSIKLTANQQLFIHPIKSLYPIEVTAAKITDAGLEHDRSFVLIKDVGPSESGVWEHLTIKTMSQLCLFRQSIDEEQKRLTVSYTLGGKVVDSISFPLEPQDELPVFSSRFIVEIFGTQAIGWDVGEDSASFFSRHLQQPVRLLFIGTHGSRAIVAPALVPRKLKPKVNKSWLGFLSGRDEEQEEVHKQQIKFNDAAPLLITSTASEDDARCRLPEEFRDEDILVRFRTNVHVETSGEADFKPYDEDSWKKVVVFSEISKQKVEVDVVFRTVRCQSLNVDFETGGLVKSERQMYKLLAKDRRVNSAIPMKPCFGVYAFAAPSGAVMSVGDRVEMVEKQPQSEDK